MATKHTITRMAPRFRLPQWRPPGAGRNLVTERIVLSSSLCLGDLASMTQINIESQPEGGSPVRRIRGGLGNTGHLVARPCRGIAPLKRRRLPVLIEHPLKIETPGKNAARSTLLKIQNEPSHPLPVLIVCLMSFNQKWGTKRCSSQLCERRLHLDRCLLESDLNENCPAHADLARYRSSRVDKPAVPNRDVCECESDRRARQTGCPRQR
jgi:hypothetical protein